MNGCGIISDLTGIEGLGLKKPTRNSKKIGRGDEWSILNDMGRNFAPIAKDIAAPVAKEMLTNYVCQRKRIMK